MAAALHVAGYANYLRNFLKKSIRPNAASFLMFAYGTTLLAFLEWRSGAAASLLALPIACAALSIVVGLLCLPRGATESIDGFEKIAFTVDIGLTVIYLAATSSSVPDHRLLTTTCLLASNLSTIVCFIPILRSTWRSPERELPTAWLIWTVAYGLLALEVLLAHQLTQPLLLLYPVLNALLHGLVAILSIRLDIERCYLACTSSTLRIRRSTINGFGLYANRLVLANEPICELKGRVKIFPKTTQPNWIGIGPNVWIDPCLPLQYINHSCNPNSGFGANRTLVATREILPGEEITLDYSTTEADPHWRMQCTCGSPLCRVELRAIHISHAHLDSPPLATPRMQRFWRRMVATRHRRRVGFVTHFLSDTQSDKNLNDKIVLTRPFESGTGSRSYLSPLANNSKDCCPNGRPLI